MVYLNEFDYPNALDVRFNPSSRNVMLGVPSRIPSIIQNLGADPARIEIDCDLDIETTAYAWIRAAADKASGIADKDNGDIFLDVMHNQSVEAPWQWLVWGNRAMRAVIDEVRFDGSTGRCTVVMHEFSDSNKADETYEERWDI